MTTAYQGLAIVKFGPVVRLSFAVRRQQFSKTTSPYLLSLHEALQKLLKVLGKMQNSG